MEVSQTPHHRSEPQSQLHLLPPASNTVPQSLQTKLQSVRSGHSASVPTAVTPTSSQRQPNPVRGERAAASLHVVHVSPPKLPQRVHRQHPRHARANVRNSHQDLRNQAGGQQPVRPTNKDKKKAIAESKRQSSGWCLPNELLATIHIAYSKECSNCSTFCTFGHVLNEH